MFWSNSDETPEESVEGGHTALVEIERDVPRPAAILRVANELEGRGAKIQELFKEVRCDWGQVVLPIHVVQEGQEFFVEVETGTWDAYTAKEAINKAAVLRSSDHAEAGLEVLSAYPVPREVGYFFGRSPAALLQLALVGVSLDEPEESAEQFRNVASRHWGVDLDYEPGYLPLVEELLMAALDEEETPPILDGLVGGLGCFVGETIRRSTDSSSAWRRDESWGEGPIIEVEHLVLDPIGKSRAFLREGPEDSVAFYADYVLRQLDGGGKTDPAAGQP
jgi:hypothetical protein